jgi:hypothetical protein
MWQAACDAVPAVLQDKMIIRVQTAKQEMAHLHEFDYGAVVWAHDCVYMCIRLCIGWVSKYFSVLNPHLIIPPPLHHHHQLCSGS